MTKKMTAIPLSFEIKKYAGMDRLSALDWLFQLESRYQLYAAIESFEIFTDSCMAISEDEKLNFLNRIVDDYFNEPFKIDRIYNFFSKKLNESVVITIYEEYEQLPSTITDSNVKIMTTKDFYSNYKFYGHLYDLEDDFFIRKIIKYEESLESIKKTPILIDLTQPNEVLIDEFKKTLDILRGCIKKVKPVKRLENYKLKKWATYQLLAYIDLYLWSRINTRTLKRPVLSRALYQYQTYCGEDTLRKNVEPIVDRLFNSHGIHDDNLKYPTQIFDELQALALENLEIY
jgi:hypothetical protein